MIVLFILIAAVQCSSKKRIQDIPEVFEPNDEFLTPQSLDMVDGYYFSRESSDSWDQEEISSWFTEIDGKTIQKLEDGNDTLINDLLGGVP